MEQQLSELLRPTELADLIQPLEIIQGMERMVKSRSQDTPASVGTRLVALSSVTSSSAIAEFGELDGVEGSYALICVSRAA